jgi:hypothetical protein
VPFHPSVRHRSCPPRKRRARLPSAQPNNPRDPHVQKGEKVAKCTLLPVPVYPPHTTSRGRVRSHSVAPSRAPLHTRFKRNAPTRSPCAAMRWHSSGRAKTRLAALQYSDSPGAMHHNTQTTGVACTRGETVRRRTFQKPSSAPRRERATGGGPAWRTRARR